MNLNFEWDQNKAQSNFKKHNVTFDEATTVFFDPLAAIFDDPKHSSHEKREIIIGKSISDRLLITSFTEKSFGVVRIISSRPATTKERKDYEQNH